MTKSLPTATQVDILLLLEGTYPYVAGGVSSWVHQLIQLFPEYQFGAIFLGGKKDDYKEQLYGLPDNLAHLEVHYLFDTDHKEQPENIVFNEKTFIDISKIHDGLTQSSNMEFIALTKQMAQSLFFKHTISEKTFLYSQSSWEYIVANYQKKCPKINFLDYFWSVRNMHMPIWQLARIADNAPKARIIHSISTGYAGFLGSLLQNMHQYPFILSEHGIYVKERKIDLVRSQWIAIGTQLEQRNAVTQQYLISMWIRFFEDLARMCYSAANPIISLFNGYQEQQIIDGAPKENTIIVPNGTPIRQDFTPKSLPNSHSPVIALIGRVVPIKDIKTFIRAMAILFEKIPDAMAWIVGPYDEDIAYYTECKELVNVLNLNQKVLFKGQQNIQTLLPTIDLMVLSSISEGLPLVIIEAFAAGIPVVATDVGACSELIYGTTGKDYALGAAGIIVEIANANSLASAASTLLENPERWKSAQKTALQRVRDYYSKDRFVDNYRKIYQEALSTWQA